MMKHRLIEQLQAGVMHLTELAREHGDKPAVIMAGSGATLSYAELDRQSNQIAHLFRARGLRPGDHIAVLMENRPEFFPVVWAAQRSGLFYTPVNWHLSAAEAAYIVADCGARLLVASSDLEELAAAAAASAPALEGRLTVGPPVPGVESLADAIAPMPDTPVADEIEGYYMLYSSGHHRPAQGHPARADRPAVRHRAEHRPHDEERLRLLADTVFLCTGPLYHGAPIGWSLGTIRNGGTAVVMERFDAVRGAVADRAVPGHPRPVRGDDVRPDAEAPRGGAGRVRHLQPAAGRAQPPRRSRSRSRSR